MSKTRKWFSCRSHSPAFLLLFHEGASEQILEKEGEPRLDCGLIKRGEKATERRACWQAISSKERHERACPGLETLVKGFQGPLTADGIAEKDGEKIDQLGSQVGITAHQPPKDRT